MIGVLGCTACTPPQKPPNNPQEKISPKPKAAETAQRPHKQNSAYVRKFSTQYARIAVQERDARWALSVYKERGVCVGKTLEKDLTRNEARRIYQVYTTSKTWADWEAAMQPLFSPTMEYTAQYGADQVMENLHIMMSLPDATKACEK
jgi:hypothetical protein